MDVLLALGLTVVLGALTVSALKKVELSVGWTVTVGGAFGVLHAIVAIRRKAPLVTVVLACSAMLVVVVVPDARVGTVGVPLVFMPSSVVFLLVLYSAAVLLEGGMRRLAPVAASAGCVLAALQSASSLRHVYPGGWWVPVYVAIGLVVTVLSTWALGTWQLLRRQRREDERAASTRSAVGAERSRIARDMHDIVAHSLAVIVRQAEGGMVGADASPDRAAQALRVIADTGREALADMRGLLGVLHNGEAARRQSLADLPVLLDRVRAVGLDVECLQRGTPYEPGLVVELAAFRVVQEALTNTIKHVGSDARTAVRLEWAPSGLAVEVTDDGGPGEAGAPVPGTGAGLQGLRERVAAAGGTIAADRRDDGFRVRADFPRGRGGGTP